MTDRDEQLGTALRELEVPEHRPGFELELRRRLEQPPPRRARRRAYVAGVGVAAAAAALVVLLVGLPEHGPTTALAARMKAKVAERLASAQTLSGTFLYRSSGSQSPAVTRGSFAMDLLGSMRVENLDTHAVAVYNALTAVERSLNTSASMGGSTLFPAERSGIAPGPPDGGPSDVFLQLQLTSFARVLLAEADPRVQPTTYDGRDAWQADVAVTPNARYADYDRLAITIDAATGVPVHVVGTLAGKPRFDLRVADLAVDARLPAGVFALRFPPGDHVQHLDDGFRRVDLSQVAAAAGYEPLLPRDTPAGYRYDTVAVAGRRGVVSLSYRRGFEQLMVTTRPRGSGPARDPFRVEGVPVSTEAVTLHGGALDGVEAHVAVDPRAAPHLWAATDGLVVTVSGDLTRDESIRVAESLQAGAGPTAASCSADELRPTARVQGATGTALGGVSVTNIGRRACDVEGRPHVRLARADGSPLPLGVVPVPPAFPPVKLAPGESAYATIVLRNWCGGAVGPVNVRVNITGVESLSAPLSGGLELARCDAPSRPPTLGVGWFQHD